MTLRLDEIEPLFPVAGRNRRRGSRTTEVTRRRFVLSGFATAAAFGLLSLVQKRALAGGSYPGSYSIRPDCYGVNFPNYGGCSASRIIGGCCTSEYLPTCPAGSGYHKHSHPTYDLRPDVCGSGGYDGWYWKYAGCLVISSGFCRKNRKWRCHDGYINGSPSICRWTVSWGTACTPCPQ